MATATNVSEKTGAVAIQGPRVKEFIDLCFTGPSSAGLVAAKPSDLIKNRVAQFQFDEIPVWVARTGYTGEDGFEVVTPAHIIESVWAKAEERDKILKQLEEWQGGLGPEEPPGDEQTW